MVFFPGLDILVTYEEKRNRNKRRVHCRPSRLEERQNQKPGKMPKNARRGGSIDVRASRATLTARRGN
jgi:hypothetical protein